MGKIFLFLLFTASLFAQSFKTVGDTTDLKTLVWNQPVLLLQFGGSTFDRTGGGIFQVIDSTYAEGIHAFDHPWSGKQWARVQYLGGASASFNSLYTNTLSLDSLVSIGTDAFTTTAEKDTVVISGAEATDSYFIQPISETLDAQDVQFQTVSKEDTLIVTRPASGASGLNYHYLRIKKH